MEIENIEEIIDKPEEDKKQEEDNKQEEQVEDKKSLKEEDEESEANSEEIRQEKKGNDDKQIGEEYQENIQEKENIIEEEEQYQELTDPFATTTYILKYKRTEEELKELAGETNLPKSENCLFMLNIKILKDESSDNLNSSQEIKDKKDDSNKFLVICCHEIAAIYFDEIYERLYTLEDLYVENKFFRVFEKIEEARSIIDESIKRNEKNSKKIFINFKDKELKLHMKLSFFDKEKEIILSIPKKILTDKDKNNLLPEFLKEIQDKMNHLKDENKKLKAKKIILDSKRAEASEFMIESDVKKENEIKSNLISENLEIKDGIKNNANNDIESKVPKKKVVKKKKIKKKTGKESDKKVKLPEENFF